MVIDFSKTQLGILETLSTRWYEFLSVFDISSHSKLPTSSIYDAIKPLKEKNIVIESNGTYRINFSNDIAWAMKRLADANKLYSLPHNVYNKIIEIREKANLFFGSRILAILVFGSSASSEIEKDSDIDFFIVLKEKREGFLNFLTSANKNFNFIENEESHFNDAYGDGDDFIISILKNHLLIQGDEYIRLFLERDLPIVSKKVIHDRELQLNKLQKKIDKLLIDNQPIIYEKIKEYIKLEIRINLMKRGIIPTSNKNFFEIMKTEYRDHYLSYKNLTRNNAKNTYIKLAGVRRWAE